MKAKPVELGTLTVGTRFRLHRNRQNSFFRCTSFRCVLKVTLIERSLIWTEHVGKSSLCSMTQQMFFPNRLVDPISRAFSEALKRLES